MADREAYLKQYYETNRERLLAKAAAYRIANREKVLAAMRKCYRTRRSHNLAVAREYRKNNTDKLRACGAVYRFENRERQRALSARHYAENKQRYIAAAARREAAQAQAQAQAQRTPQRSAEFTTLAAGEAYDLAARRTKATGFAWHVDHVIPLRGVTVSGLHVWNNFAVIPASVNRAKSNYFQPGERV